MRVIQLLAVLLVVVFLPSQRAFADDDEVTEDANGNLPPGYVRSVNAINSGVHPTVSSLELAAEYAVQHKYFDQAIKICQQAIAMNDDDADIHMAYADALEHKLRTQKAGARDPNLFMATVREWLIVARNEKGDERGLTNSKGVGIPGMQHMYQDEERSMPAVHHIVRLVGYLPKAKETDQKYLLRVAKQCEYSLNGKVISSGSKSDSNADQNAKSHGQKSAQSKHDDSM